MKLLQSQWAVAYLGFWLGGLNLDRRPFPSPPSLPSPHLIPFPILSSPPLHFSLQFPALPLLLTEVGPLNAGVSFPSGLWGGAPAEIEFGAF